MDQPIVIALNQWAHSQPALAALIVVVARGGIFALPLALVACWLWPGPGRPARRQAVLAGAVAFALAALVSVGLGLVIDRPRPFVALAIPPLFAQTADSSFPSDHTLLGLALVGPLLWRRPRRGLWLGLAVLVIGFARVASGVHYPSDIVGSAGLAGVLAGLALALTAAVVGRLPSGLARCTGLAPAPSPPDPISDIPAGTGGRSGWPLGRRSSRPTAGLSPCLDRGTECEVGTTSAPGQANPPGREA